MFDCQVRPEPGAGLLISLVLVGRIICLFLIRIPTGAFSINVLKQIFFDILPQWIKDNINTLSARQLRCGDEITVSSDQYNLFYLMLIREGG